MPIYEYDCSGCGRRFEIRASAPQSPGELRCPECRSARVRRYYGSVALVSRSRGRTAAEPTRDPAPGELRTADAGDLTRNVARRYAAGTADRALKEVARRAERGDGPAELHELVRELKSEPGSKHGKHELPG